MCFSTSYLKLPACCVVAAIFKASKLPFNRECMSVAHMTTYKMKNFPLSFSAITLLEMFATTLGKIMLRRLELRKTLKCLKLRTCYICLLKLNFITRFASLADHTT